MELERLTPQQFDKFRKFIYRKSGIRIDENKVTLLSNRIRRRLKVGPFEDFDVYYRYLTTPAGAAELEGFLDAITTHETFFFRTEKHFQWLKESFLAEVIAQHRSGNRPPALRIWSAGCAPASIRSITSWIACTQPGLFTLGFMVSGSKSHAGSSGCFT